MKEHVLKRGETLVDLSVRYGVPVCMIVRANIFCCPGDIEAGVNVRIPPVDFCLENIKKDAESAQTYVVCEGENIFDVSCKCGVPMRIILRENGIGAHDLFTGRVLKIPPKKAGMVLYSSKMGESYESIAQKFSVSVHELVRINGTNMYPGMQIYVPVM